MFPVLYILNNAIERRKALFYRDYAITNKWWIHQLSIVVDGKEIFFDNMEELKNYVNSLYE